MIKKPRTRGGYSPARGLQNTNPQWVVAPVENKYIYKFLRHSDSLKVNSDFNEIVTYCIELIQ